MALSLIENASLARRRHAVGPVLKIEMLGVKEPLAPFELAARARLNVSQRLNGASSRCASATVPPMGEITKPPTAAAIVRRHQRRPFTLRE